MERMIELHWHHGHGVVWLKPSAVVAVVDYSRDALGSRPAVSGVFLDGHGSSLHVAETVPEILALINGPGCRFPGVEPKARPQAVRTEQTELPCPSCK